MFDIGFWELLVIGVVALFVVGPERFPELVQTAGRMLGKLRRFVGSVKDDLQYEVDKAEELKKLMEREANLAEAHKKLNEDVLGSNLFNVTTKSSGNDESSVQPSATQNSNHVDNDNTTQRSNQTASKPLSSGASVDKES